MNTIYLTMTIPNVEIRSIYRTSIREWLTQKIEQTDFSQFYQAVLEENCPAMEAFMKRQLSESISYYNSAENFYHGYLVGVLSGLEGYALDSANKKSSRN